MENFHFSDLVPCGKVVRPLSCLTPGLLLRGDLGGDQGKTVIYFEFSLYCERARFSILITSGLVTKNTKISGSLIKNTSETKAP
jgi:hypothetical protein